MRLLRSATIAFCTFANSSGARSEEHTSELQSHHDLVCRLLLEKKKYKCPHWHIITKIPEIKKYKTPAAPVPAWRTCRAGRRDGRKNVRRPTVFFFNDTATTEIYTLSLHDALPI